jgi:hypothetical protein
MTKSKVWCCHPVRHSEASKIGRVPSHPKGKYLVSPKMVNFLKKQYDVAIINPSQSNMANFYICTSCHEYEMDRFQRIKTSVGDQQLSDNDDQSNEHSQLRLSMGSLNVEDNFEISTSQRAAEAEQSGTSSEDEFALSFDRHAAKKIFNDVFRILKIEAIVDT